MLTRVCLLFLMLINNVILFAQSGALTESKTIYMPSQFSYNLGATYFKPNDYFFQLKLNAYQKINATQADSNSNIFKNANLLNGLNTVYTDLIFAKNISTKSYLGLNPSANTTNEITNYSIRPFFVHNGGFYGLYLIEEFGLKFEKYKYYVNSNLGKTLNSQNNFSFDFAFKIAYKFNLIGFPIRTQLSYKGIIMKEQIKGNSIYDNQFVDFSEYKFSINSMIGKHLNVGLNTGLNNAFYLSLATSKTPEYTISQRTPVIGFELNYFIGNPNDKGNFSYIF